MKIWLFLHLLGASVWVGGHLYLFLRLMPEFVRTQNITAFLDFEKKYEPFGMAALVIQIVTGVYMAQKMLPFGQWFNVQIGFFVHMIWAKLLWLVLTLVTAVFARFFVIKRLQSNMHTPKTLKIMHVLVGLICLYSLGFVWTGVLFRGL